MFCRFAATALQTTLKATTMDMTLMVTDMTLMGTDMTPLVVVVQGVVGGTTQRMKEAATPLAQSMTQGK